MKIEVPTVIKFDNGDIVIALLDENANIEHQGFLDILFPIKVISDIFPQGEQMVEKFSLQPWIALSDEIAYRISTKGITVLSPLRGDYEAGYQRMVENFFTSLNEDDTMLDETMLDNPLDDETILEYMEAKKHNKVN